MKTFLFCFFFPMITYATQLKCSYDFGNKIIFLPEVNKTMTFEKVQNDIKYQAVIKDFKKFSELENYIILSKDDKKITYSLSCQKTK